MSFRNTVLILGFCIFVHFIFTPNHVPANIVRCLLVFSMLTYNLHTLESNKRLVRKNGHKQVTSGHGFPRRLKMAAESENSVWSSPQQSVRLTFSWISTETPKPEDKSTGMSTQGQSIHFKTPSGLRLSCVQILHILFLIEIELHHSSTFSTPSVLTCPSRLSCRFRFLWLYLLHMYITHVCVCKITCIRTESICVVCVFPADQCALDNWQVGLSWQRLIPLPFSQQPMGICKFFVYGKNPAKQPPPH